MWVIGSERLPKAENFQTRRLYFAGVVLSGLGLLFLFAMGVYAFNPTSDGEPERGKEILDTAKTIIPPIITLVLGYYFGQDNPEPESNNSDLELDQAKQGE